MKKQTNTDLRRKLREQRAAYEELLGLSGAILAALCVRCGDGATLRLPKQAVHDALETYEFAAAADGEIEALAARFQGKGLRRQRFARLRKAGDLGRTRRYETSHHEHRRCFGHWETC